MTLHDFTLHLVVSVLGAFVGVSLYWFVKHTFTHRGH